MRSIGIRGGVWIAALTIMSGTASFAVAGDRATGAAEAKVPADNTGRNTRDADGDTATADSQSNNKNDVELTRQIRRAITKDDSLSTNAHNVKIVTQDGAVTLRGPVKSEAEKRAVAKKAESVNGVGKVDNQLEVAQP